MTKAGDIKVKNFNASYGLRANSSTDKSPLLGRNFLEKMSLHARKLPLKISYDHEQKRP